MSTFSRFCPDCGVAVNSDQARFCIACGAPLRRATTAGEGQSDPTPTVQLPNARIAQQVIGGTVKLPALGAVPPGFWAFDHAPGPEDVVAIYPPLRPVRDGWSGLVGRGWIALGSDMHAGRKRFHFRTEAEARALGRGIGDFSNVDGAGQPLATTSRAYMFKLADRLWHSDSSFNAIPATYSVLSGRTIPSWGGNTEFADMRAAWDSLDDRTRTAIDGLVCLHSQIHSRSKVGFTELTEAERIAFLPVRHRLVRTHPVTGRRSLFLSSHAGEIEGMSLPEARILLLDPTEFATQPRFVYAHAWRVHDLVMWDNQATMHRGRPFDPAEPRDIRQTRLRCREGTIAQFA